jgi:hypothetical protein
VDVSNVNSTVSSRIIGVLVLEQEGTMGSC